MTADRAEQVDFAGPYLYASIVCLTKADSAFADAKGLSGLAGGTCTSQLGTIWYDTCLPQIKGAQIQTASESAPAMSGKAAHTILGAFSARYDPDTQTIDYAEALK